MIKYQLHQCSTGKLLYTQELEEPISMCKWQKKVCRKLLKYKHTNPEIRKAILEEDVLAGWANYDSLRRAGYEKELDTWAAKLFGCYPSF